jgi:ATP-dependent helicase/nuclease subunit A
MRGMMKMNELTKDQKKAVLAKKGNFLVSAGAGSGKTKVLTDRVIELLSTGECSLDELLVLTFTDKAADEMKNKVRDKLVTNPLTAPLASQIDSAYIMTFDAFFRSLVSKYHYELGINGSIDVADESLLKAKLDNIVVSTLEEHYQKRDPGLLKLASLYAEKDDKNIQQMIKLVIHQASLVSDKNKFYADYEKTYFSNETLLKDVCHLYTLAEDKINAAVSKAKDGFSSEAIDAKESDDVLAFLSPFASSRNYDELYECLTKTRKFPRIKPKLQPEDKEVFASIKDLFGEASSLISLGSQQEVINDYLSTKDDVLSIVALAHEVDGRLEQFQKENAVYSFSDIASLARQAMKIDSIKAELKSHFHFVMIDEYQDTSDLQENFINELDCPNVFEVGDIKQSIYRFRNANPDFFKSKFDNYKLGNGGSLITMGDNFRSRETVVNEIDNLFDNIMSEDLGGINFNRENQALKFGATSFSASEKEANRSIEIYTHDEDLVHKKEEIEPNIVANDILKKMRDGYPLKGSKPAEFKDFAILVSAKSCFPFFKRVFKQAHIPLEITDKPSGNKEDVILTFKRVVHLISIMDSEDCPNKEEDLRHCYLSIMRSYLFSEKDNDLYNDIVSKKYLSSPLFNMVKKDGTSLKKGSLRLGVEKIFSSLPFFANLPLVGNVKNNYEKLSSLRSIASSLDKMHSSWEDFDNYFSDLDRLDLEIPLESGQNSKNAVHLMSIHASKGLQFPIVYIPSLDKRFNLDDSKGSFLFSKKFGLLIPVDPASKPVSFLHLLNKELVDKEARNEAMRLFYVGLTRAEEKLILVEKTPKDLSATFNGTPSSFASFLAMGEVNPSHYHKKTFEELIPFINEDEKKEVMSYPPFEKHFDNSQVQESRSCQ